MDNKNIKIKNIFDNNKPLMMGEPQYNINNKALNKKMLKEFLNEEDN